MFDPSYFGKIILQILKGCKLLTSTVCMYVCVYAFIQSFMHACLKIIYWYFTGKHKNTDNYVDYFSVFDVVCVKGAV